jgi:hypothetical protein
MRALLRLPLLLNLVVPLLAACSRSAPQQPVGAAPPSAASSTTAPLEIPPSAADCTLATRLVPGIPGSPGHLIPSPRNPNGQSELSAHMRLMQSDLAAARSAILGGTAVAPMLARHRKIRCAWPTRPADRDEALDASARHYLDAVAALDGAAPSQRAAAFTSVLGACRACHEHTCSGAIVAIDALALPAEPRPAP